MYATAAIFVLFLCSVDLAVSGNINTYTSESGESVYSTALSCSYPTLYMVSPYTSIRATYRATDDKRCCYLQDTRHKCCLYTDSKDSTQTCKCDPSVTCGATTTTVTTPTTTTVPTTTTTTTLPTTTTRTTRPTTTTLRTTRPTTTTLRTTRPTTTKRTTVPTTRTTTTVPTTTSTTTVPSTTSTTTIPTTASTTTVPTTTTTTVRTTTTARPTTRTTKATTTTKRTTIKPTTTTKKPTTTTKKPTTTTRTTTTTTRTTTTTPSKALCRSTFRVLNGDSSSIDCSNSGVFNVTSPDGSTSACNAVYTRAFVNGVYKPTILTAEICKNFAEMDMTAENAYQLSIGTQKYKIMPPMFTLVSGPDGTAYFDVAQSESSILDDVSACQENVRCAYNKTSMQGKVDLTNCKIYSWGVSNADEYSQNGLNEVALTNNEGGCQDIADPSVPGSFCFKTTSGQTLICGNDFGAPVYCKALETEEWLLMGVVGLQTQCDESPNVSVLPHPA